MRLPGPLHHEDWESSLDAMLEEVEKTLERLDFIPIDDDRLTKLLAAAPPRRVKLP